MTNFLDSLIAPVAAATSHAPRARGRQIYQVCVCVLVGGFVYCHARR